MSVYNRYRLSHIWRDSGLAAICKTIQKLETSHLEAYSGQMEINFPSFNVYWLFKTTLITCRGKITTILLRKTQESFRKVLVSLCDHAIKFVECFLACVKT